MWVLPNRFGFPRFRIFDRIARARGPLAFIDESFQAPSQDPDSFYIIAAAVIEKDQVLEVRKRLANLVQNPTWHTTEAGRTERGKQKIRELASYLAIVSKPVIVVLDQLASSDRSAEAGRAQAIRALLAELASEHMYLTGTVFYERRVPGFMQEHDELIFERIRQSKLEGARLQVVGLATKKEPLLWIPDIICWAYRRAYLDGDHSFFNELGKVAKVIRFSEPEQK
ncbi:MAG: hypothetical protein RL068_293 [Actinomycetota bacterium]